MGNCQAAEAATVLVVHPGGKVDRVYWSVSANEIMNSNPGHYVAQVVSPAPAGAENGVPPAKQLKLLRPDDTLVIGQVYRLISFEDVLKEFAAKKSVKLGKLLKERGALSMEKKKHQSGLENSSSTSQLPSIKTESSDGGGSGSNGSRRHHRGGSGQWRPALYSISEIGI